MNREDIIRMAREAGIIPLNVECDPTYIPVIERFAALVTAHVRETEFKPDWNNYQQGRADGAAEEREACAKVCDELHWPWHMGDNSGPKECAAAIRARGQA